MTIDAPVPQMPRRVRVGSRWYTLSRVVRIDGVDAWGETAANANTIKIRDDVPETHMPEMMLHEFIHAILMDRDLDGAKADEHFVFSFTHGLTAVLQDLGWLPTRLKLADDG